MKGVTETVRNKPGWAVYCGISSDKSLSDLLLFFKQLMGGTGSYTRVQIEEALEVALEDMIGGCAREGERYFLY